MAELTANEVATLLWLTVRELARRWNVSTDAIYEMLTEKNPAPTGKLLGCKFGGSWRIHITTVQAFEARGITKGRKESAKFGTVPDALGRRPKAGV